MINITTYFAIVTSTFLNTLIYSVQLLQIIYNNNNYTHYTMINITTYFTIVTSPFKIL